MAAFNNVDVEIVCPACSRQAKATFQLHLAASFGGDERSRFCHINYKVGDILRWWNLDHPRYKPWLTEDGIAFDEGYAECCYGDCSNCKADLYAIVVVKDLLIESIAEIGLERNWPAGFPM